MAERHHRQRTGQRTFGHRWLRRIVLPPMLQQRENIMTPAEKIEYRNIVARRLFDALCAHYPDKYVASIIPPLRQKRLERCPEDTGGCRWAALLSASSGVLRLWQSSQSWSNSGTYSPVRATAPPPSKSNQVPTMADHRWPVRMPIR